MSVTVRVLRIPTNRQKCVLLSMPDAGNTEVQKTRLFQRKIGVTQIIESPAH